MPALTALEVHQIPYVVTGTLATEAHGVGRYPVDVLIATNATPQELAPILSDTYECWLAPLDWSLGYGETRAPQLRHRRYTPDIPLLPLRPAALHRAERLTVAHDSTAVLLASAEDVVLDLLPFVAPRPRSGSQLWYDLVSVLKAQVGRLDLDYLRQEAGEQVTALEDLLVQAETVPLARDITFEREMAWIASFRRRALADRLWLTPLTDRYGE
jgi:hypothetical protein